MPNDKIVTWPNPLTFHYATCLNLKSATKNDANKYF